MPSLEYAKGCRRLVHRFEIDWKWHLSCFEKLTTSAVRICDDIQCLISLVLRCWALYYNPVPRRRASYLIPMCIQEGYWIVKHAWFQGIGCLFENLLTIKYGARVSGFIV